MRMGRTLGYVEVMFFPPQAQVKSRVIIGKMLWEQGQHFLGDNTNRAAFYRKVFAHFYLFLQLRHE